MKAKKEEKGDKLAEKGGKHIKTLKANYLRFKPLKAIKYI